MIATTIAKRSARGISSRALSTFPVTQEAPLSASLSPSAAPAAKIEEKTLSNGVKLIARTGASKISTIKFSVNAGSRSELVNEKGAAHLLSYCAFEGTQQRSGLRLVREMENHAFVMKNKTCRERNEFCLQAAPEFVSEAISSLGEAVFSPPKHSYIINERKPTAAHDYKLLEWCGQANLKEMIFEAAYGEGTPMGGSFFSHSLNKLDAEDVLAYRSRNFTAGNLVIAADGVSLSELEKGAAGFVGSATSIADSPFVGGCVRRRADFNGEVHAAIAFPALPSAQNRVLHNMLATRLAEKSKGTDLGSVSTFMEGGLECITVSAGSTAAAEALLSMAVAELKAVASGSDKSNAVQKKVSLSNLVSLEGGESATDVMLAANAAGVSLSDFVDVRNVTSDNVQSAAKSMLQTTPAYAVVGASYGMQSYASICSSLK